MGPVIEISPCGADRAGGHGSHRLVHVSGGVVVESRIYKSFDDAARRAGAILLNEGVFAANPPEDYKPERGGLGGAV